MDDRLLALAAMLLDKKQRTLAFDGARTDSRPTAAQQAIFDDLGVIPHRYVLGGNQSGKSQLGAREVAWIFSDTHPNWERPQDWAKEPLVILVVGRTTKQIEEVLWRKISAFLEDGEYRTVNSGGALQKVVHNETKNTIIFASHHNDNEAREKVQAYVANYVWLDEMPGSYKLLEELHRRIQARKGYFLATFTPKVVNAAIRKLVDSSDGKVAAKYTLKMFDNPVYDDEMKEQITQSLSTYSESYRNTILQGDWATGDNAVYHFDPNVMVEEPENYHPGWRHVESVDPALKSKMGYTLWAENPATGVWYCVKADYIQNILVPEDVFEHVRQISDGYNIVRRISDYEPWYVNTASKHGVAYVTPFNKNNTKGELIKGLQQALESEIRIAPWCHDLIEEFVSCQWSETADSKIVNSSSYHLLDASQYFVRCRPPFRKDLKPQPWHVQLREGNRARRKAEIQARKVKKAAGNNRVVKKGIWKSRGAKRWGQSS